MPRPVETLATRLTLAREKRQLTQVQLAALSGLKQPDISKIERGLIQQTTAIARLSRALGVPHQWLELGEGDEPSWEFRAGEPPVEYSVAHSLSLRPFDHPPRITWEDILARDRPLPDRFIVAVADDALAPLTPRGTELIFDLSASPAPGVGVLIEDQKGQRCIRRFVQAAGDRWIAATNNPSYASLDSIADGLRVVAVAMGRLDGSV